MKNQFIIKTTKKGQMTLPKLARAKLGVRPGEPVTVTVDEQGVRVERLLTLAEVRQLTETRRVWPGDEAADQIVAEGMAHDFRADSHS